MEPQNVSVLLQAAKLCLEKLNMVRDSRQRIPLVFLRSLIVLKTLDTIGNCQRPVFSLGVSQHMHKNYKSVKILAQSVMNVAR